MDIKREEIYLTSFDLVIGREISKTRPVVVVSNNKNNKYSGTVTILPITSKSREKFTFSRYSYLKEPGTCLKTQKLKRIRSKPLIKEGL